MLKSTYLFFKKYSTYCFSFLIAVFLFPPFFPSIPFSENSVAGLDVHYVHTKPIHNGCFTAFHNVHNIHIVPHTAWLTYMKEKAAILDTTDETAVYNVLRNRRQVYNVLPVEEQCAHLEAICTGSES